MQNKAQNTAPIILYIINIALSEIYFISINFLILISVYDLNAAIMKYNTKAKIRRGQCATNNDFNKLILFINYYCNIFYFNLNNYYLDL